MFKMPPEVYVVIGIIFTLYTFAFSIVQINQSPHYIEQQNFLTMN